LGFLVLALVVHRAPQPRGFDETVMRWATSPSVAEGFGLIPSSRSLAVFTELATLGSLLPALFMLAALATVAAFHRDRLALTLCVLGPAAAVLLAVMVAKPLVDRVREGALMFPSGHVTVAAAVAAVACVVAYRSYGPRRLLVAGPVAALLPIAVSLGVVRMNWHYPTDTLGGLMLGTGVVLAVAAVLPERWPPKPVLDDPAGRVSVPVGRPQR
jgi:membrane-associated phospholipid phosphatase